jgi:hypothetical protein
MSNDISAHHHLTWLPAWRKSPATQKARASVYMPCGRCCRRLSLQTRTGATSAEITAIVDIGMILKNSPVIGWFKVRYLKTGQWLADFRNTAPPIRALPQ